jgi:hypothetical protein
MLIRRPTRFPLTPGDSAIALVWGLGVVGMLLFGHRFFVSHLTAPVSITLALIKLVWLFVLVPVVARTVWRRRASDIVITPEGVTIEGGPRHGRRWTWSQLASEPIEAIHEDHEHRLSIGPTTLAETYDSDEAASFEALALTLRAAQREPGRRGTLGPEVLHCASCGAPLTPVDAPTAPCTHCGAPAAMPEGVRAAAGSAAARAATARALDELLRWRRARPQNALLALSFVPAVMAWPLAALFFALFMERSRSFDWLDLVTLIAIAHNLTWTLSLVIQSRLVARRAVGLLAARFRARPPEAEGEGCACRHCGGPLPVVDDERGASLVVCAYCRADNVVGLGLAQEALDDQRQARELDALVAERAAERRLWVRRTTLSIVGLVATPYFLADLVLRAR